MSRLALCRGGEILQTATIRIGPRLLTLDATGKLMHFEPVLGAVAEAAGVALEEGVEPSGSDLKTLADELAESLLNLIERRPLEPLARHLLVGASLDLPDRPNGASFSGGAAAHLYGSQPDLGLDLGPALGRAIHQRLNRLGFGVQEPEHLLTATIIGSAQYRLEDVHAAPILTEPAAFAAAQELDAKIKV
jgi:ethanolamine utilization protein EutA (predicted chaperonin)